MKIPLMLGHHRITFLFCGVKVKIPLMLRHRRMTFLFSGFNI
jgi:hypothetical protein